MPVMIDEHQVLARWAGEKSWCPLKSAHTRSARTAYLNIALINNMPDSALEDTELQFADLLGAAAGDIPVRLKFYSLPGITRSDRVQKHLSNSYFSIEDLWNSRFDGVIITGTEPRWPDLREEPYWSALVKVFDWAEHNTASAVLSCLGAHASVLYSDGLDRHALSDKQFGVFRERKVSDHALMRGAGDMMRFPHSRWNEVQEDALTSSGYVVLTKSTEAGVNLFVKKKRESLFVHFQGHPEYGPRTLLREYRRDVSRFLRQERETYPSMPREYFDTASTKLLKEFQENALSNPRKELMAEFPEVVVARALKNSWRSPAVCIYRNWLRYVASQRTDTSAIAPIARVGLG
jgi:homoserine O-succinyltransferase/O-acetyltransferase